MRRGILLALACAAAAALSAGCSSEEPFGQASYSWQDLVRFDGVTYAVLESREAGRPLHEDDLGPKFAEVQHNVSDEGTGYRVQDGDAAYLKPGTPVYELAGYDPAFRLAARQGGDLTLYEAVSNPRARVGGDLLDIEGKVSSISVTHPEDVGKVLAIFRDPETVGSLVRGLMEAPTRRIDPDHFGLRDTYLVVFSLADGTAAAREYRTDTGQLGSNGTSAIATPEGFRKGIRASLEGYLKEREALREASVMEEFSRVRACEDTPETDGTRTIDRGVPYTTNDAPDGGSSGVLNGTEGPDRLAGEDGEDEVRGGDGDDIVEGGLCDDEAYGGPGDDEVMGAGAMETDEEGDDVLHGGPGEDQIGGDKGDDVIYGDDGDDIWLQGGGGEDSLYGGKGDDLLDAERDGHKDELHCGDGRDSYIADEIDLVADDCEVKTKMMVQGSS